jgi:hypothetical protein
MQHEVVAVKFDRMGREQLLFALAAGGLFAELAGRDAVYRITMRADDMQGISHKGTSINPDFISTDETTSHSTKLPKNGNQVAGYAVLRKNFLLTYQPYAALRNYSAPCIRANSESLEAPLGIPQGMQYHAGEGVTADFNSQKFPKAI